ncbi:MAG: hypothetical protein US49_C0010G0033 [candidate division TM6 bacterium GW2011_GWF2_37_49]|nr:MAG: hypothetical protein US49_C0010G0033 [candidate division TM6 bacterium GW2011_GWF2_37_49]
MPAPLIHVALAIIALQGQLEGVDKKSFIIGTSFPDIRYLNVIDRKKTHIKNVSWDQILQEKNPFKIGYLFHSFVDQLFDDFMIKQNIYEKLPKSQFTPQSFKLFADKVLYKRMRRQLPGIIDCFDDVISEELSFEIKREDIIRWHSFLKKYFSSQYQCDFCALAKEYSMLQDSSVDAINSSITDLNDESSLAKKFALKLYNFASKHIKEQKKYILST